MEAALWTLATTNDQAFACSTRGDCLGGIYTAYKVTPVPVWDADKATVRAIASEKILPDWAARCEKTYKGCAKVWNDSIGAALGLTIPAN